jgi:hypothetical protein
MMPKSVQPNYPDILGEITDGQRLQIGVVDAAMTVRPRIVRAGESAEIILLLQNTTDVRVEVVAEPKVPARDANGKTDRFILKTSRMTAVLSPAEVGYVSLPLYTTPDAAPENGYRVFFTISVKPQAKYHIVRRSDEPITQSYFFSYSPAILKQINDLKMLDFSISKTGLLGTSIETTFDLAPARKTSEAPAELKPSWNRLWAMSDNTDTRYLLEQHGKVLQKRILPLLERDNLYKPFYRSTMRRFAAHGYQLTPDEAHYITKLLVDVLEMGRRLPIALLYPDQAVYGVSQRLEEGWAHDGRPVALPFWCRDLLTRIASDPRITERPVMSLATILYDSVLRDAITHGFALVHLVIKRPLGTKVETERLAAQFTKDLRNQETCLNFDDVYLPLVLGGIIVDTEVPLQYENPIKRLHAAYDHLRQMRPRGGTEVEKLLVYSVACKVCDWALEKHGFRFL